MSMGHGMVIKAATDGACSGNPGPGGWGLLYRFEDGFIEERGGFEQMTTNNRMELKAALVLLRCLKDVPLQADLKIYTDSKYLIDGLDQWIIGWKKKGWRTSAGKPVLNQDLWRSLDSARIEGVSFAYVKGHSGDPDNDRVDQIAVSFAKGQPIKLCTKKSSISKRVGVDSFTSTSDASFDLQSSNLNQLLSRLELADRLAEKGYSLSTSELADLVEQPISILKTRHTEWRWRDWLVKPMDNQSWRLYRQ